MHIINLNKLQEVIIFISINFISILHSQNYYNIMEII
jgi:hypothetical protein